MEFKPWFTSGFTKERTKQQSVPPLGLTTNKHTHACTHAHTQAHTHTLSQFILWVSTHKHTHSTFILSLVYQHPKRAVGHTDTLGNWAAYS